jgi:hypothetical protein
MYKTTNPGYQEVSLPSRFVAEPLHRMWYDEIHNMQGDVLTPFAHMRRKL